MNKNFIAGVDISKHPEISNIHQKSFLKLNNKNQIIDIEEKKIISDKICIGFIRLAQQMILFIILKIVLEILKVKKFI